MRQNDLAIEVREYLKCHPNAAVVNLGCGLDSAGRACDNGKCKLYNLDFPDVIAVRNELLPAREREENIPCDLNDTSWFERIDASGGAVFFAPFRTPSARSVHGTVACISPAGAICWATTI